MNIQYILSERINQAMILTGIQLDNFKPKVQQTHYAKFGDYQINGIISIAKKLGLSPKKLAKIVIQNLDLKDIASRVEIAGIGFINIFLNRTWVAKNIKQMLILPKLGISRIKTQTIVIDYSGPNIAKEMHVGHLRSTIIGDAMVRILEFFGHKVIRANHIGDWGTQFGMLLAFFEKQQDKKSLNDEIILNDLENFYFEAKKEYEKNSSFAELARKYVVKLQNGDKYCLNLWNKLVTITMNQNQKIYNRLNVTLTNRDVMGESLYNNMLPDIISDLKQKGLALESQGATVVFLDEFKNKEGQSMGVIVKKKDGGYLYATTDIACIKYRYEKLKADRIIYYTDSRQNQHLLQIWNIVRKANYIPKSLLLEHHSFGMILNKNGQPFKTRSGKTVKLSNLLDEAVKRAYKIVKHKNININEEDTHKLAEIIGIGAVKYTELSKNRNTDYIFDWDKMLTFEGNTAPYMQYAYSRIMSIFRKIQNNFYFMDADIVITNDTELELAISLLRFEETANQIMQNGMPHIMCNYLYILASKFSVFYETCPILNATETYIKMSRLQLSLLTAKILQIGLEMLGIKTIEHM
ncbi:MAG: arginine--tRNA ligase [Pantoea sp. Brub]|nr:arginine--tRNA ligase [Pantoea sp. Brub]